MPEKENNDSIAVITDPNTIRNLSIKFGAGPRPIPPSSPRQNPSAPAASIPILTKPPRPSTQPPSKPTSADWLPQYNQALKSVEQNLALLEPFARELGIPITSLDAFACGVDRRGHLICPMYDGNGNICGAQARDPDAPKGTDNKKNLPGSKLGLFHAKGFSVTSGNSGGPPWRCHENGITCPICKNTSNNSSGCVVYGDPHDPYMVDCVRIKEGSTGPNPPIGFRHRLKPVEAPPAVNDNPLHIVEGFSDAARLHAMGLDAIGKPSAKAGLAFLLAKLSGTRRPIISWGERDQKANGDWPGREGMEKTAIELVKAGHRVLMVLPPDIGPTAKDARSWINNNHISVEELTRHIEHNKLQPPIVEGGVGRTTSGDLISLTTTHHFFLSGGIPHVSFLLRPGVWHVCPIGDDTYENWLLAGAVKQFQKAPSTQAIEGTQRLLQGRTFNEGKEEPIFNRIAWDEPHKRTIIDLADEGNHCVIATKDGWEVKEFPRPPVHFRRQASTGSLPWPVKGGSLSELRPLINVNDNDFILYVASLLGPYMPHGAIPPLGLAGGQGDGKSSAAEIAQRNIDPQRHPPGMDEEESALPATERDLAILAHHAGMLAFNNLSSISPTMADAICRLVSGGRLDQRALYTDGELARFSSRCFVILAGIGEELLSRPDLRDRVMICRLLPLDPNKRITGHTYYQQFEEMRSRIFGAILTALSTALKNLPSTPSNPFRMGEFVRFIESAEPSLPWKPGDFRKAYQSDRDSAAEISLELSPLGQVIAILVENQEPVDGIQSWHGTTTQIINSWQMLLSQSRLPSGKGVQADVPPLPPNIRNNFREAGTELARILPALRRVGITHERKQRTKKNRPHIFSKQYSPPCPSAKASKSAIGGVR
jgi:hypothetical protein